MPAVSIILPLYNGQPYIKHTIDRIRSQTFQDWELLIINDGSTDDGEAAALQEAQKDRRIRVLRKSNGGISSARNYGLSKAAGKYIAFADQDDTAGKNWLTALFNGMAQNADLAVGGKKLTVIDALGKTVTCRVCRYEDTLLETEKELYGFLFNQKHDASSQHVWNCMYKKELMDAHGIRFNENLAMGMEDVLFNICYGYYCRKIHKIPQVVYSYIQRAGISTSTKYNPDIVKEYACRMQVIAKLFGFSCQSGAYRMYKGPKSTAYRMYGDYALRELCNLYFRNVGNDSFGLLSGLRDAYVEYVPDKIFYGKGPFEKITFGKKLFRRILYAAADNLLREENYFLFRLLKSGAHIRGPGLHEKWK